MKCEGVVAVCKVVPVWEPLTSHFLIVFGASCREAMTATPVKGVQVRGTLFSTSCPAATTATPVEGVLVRGT